MNTRIEEVTHLSQTMNIRCPHCSRKYSVSTATAGKQATCKGCSKPFRIPEPPVKPPAPPPVPAPPKKKKKRRIEFSNQFLVGASVSYDCEHCGEALASSVNDIGHTDECPVCQKAYVVPGTDEFRVWEAGQTTKATHRLITDMLTSFQAAASTPRSTCADAEKQKEGGKRQKKYIREITRQCALIADVRFDPRVFSYVKMMLSKEQLPGLSGWRLSLLQPLFQTARSNPSAIADIKTFVEKYPSDSRSIWNNTPSERGLALYNLTLGHYGWNSKTTRSIVCYVAVSARLDRHIDRFSECHGNRDGLVQAVGRYNATAPEPLVGDDLQLIADSLGCTSLFSSKLDAEVYQVTERIKGQHLKSQLDLDEPAEKAKSLHEEMKQAERRAAAAKLARDLRFSFNAEDYLIVGPDYSRDSRIDRFYRNGFRIGLTEAFGGKCAKCGEGMSGLEFDHFWFPKSKGGNFAMRLRRENGIIYINNCIPLCRSCNSSKGAKSYDVFFSIEELDRLLRINASITSSLNQAMVSCNDVDARKASR